MDVWCIYMNDTESCINIFEDGDRWWKYTYEKHNDQFKLNQNMVYTNLNVWTQKRRKKKPNEKKNEERKFQEYKEENENKQTNKQTTY